MTESSENLIATVLGIFVVLLMWYVVGGGVVWLLFNHLLHPLFGAPTVTYVQGIMFTILVQVVLWTVQSALRKEEA